MSLLVNNAPKTRRSRKALEEREPKLVENTKTAMFIKGIKSSQIIQNVLTDLYMLKKPDAVWYKRKDTNVFRPFEDITTLEFYSTKSDASLFAFGTNTKKRPDTLVLGRMFNYHLLDMVEFGVSNFKSLRDFVDAEKNAVGSKPCFVLDGEAFQSNETMKVVGNLFVDFFRGTVVDKISLVGLDHVIALTAVSEDQLLFRHYFVRYRKSATSKVPEVVLEECGPSMDLAIRRTKLGSDDLRKEASKQPKELKPTKTKNQGTTALKESVGAVHVPRQKMDNLTTKKPRGLKRSRSQAAVDGGESASKRTKGDDN